MFGLRNTSLSKLKSLSKALECSFSSLRFLFRSTLTQQSKINITKCNSCNFNFFQKNVFRSLSIEHSNEENYREVDMQSITQGNEDLLKKLKVLMLEVEVMRQDGNRVPSKISDDNWKELLSKPTRSQRIKQLSFWHLNEIKRLKEKKKKEEARIKREMFKTEDKKETDHIHYGFGGNTIFLRIYDSTIDRQMNQKAIQAMMFGEKLIVDCSYDEHMTPKEASLCAKQLCYMFAENRMNVDPFNLYFCNANKESKVAKQLLKHIPTLYDDTFPLNITEKSYLEFFPKEKLVYLTPHCRTNLKTYNHDDIYIIGAMVDTTNDEPHSLGKAKSLGLRMARLPLDLYLDWGVGTKSLTLNQVQSILLEMKNTNDWKKAFQHVPKRKLKEDQDNNIKKIQYLRKINLVQ